LRLGRETARGASKDRLSAPQNEVKFMRALLFIVLTLGASTGYSNEFNNFKNRVITATNAGLVDCGLSFVHPDSPGLPFRQVPADQAIISPTGRLLAYTEAFFTGFGHTAVYKNPDGGMVHAASAGNWGVEFQTPYAGTVASASSYRTPDGLFYRYLCRGTTYVDFAGFERCVNQYFVQVVVGQLCRFGNP
jgi:hypothetical protein